MSLKKTMTPGLKKAMDARDKRHQGRTKILAKDLSSVVYLWVNTHGQYLAMGYSGRKTKPDFFHAYREEVWRSKFVHQYMSNKSKETISSAPEPRGLEEGDVLYYSWGYEQTNIDFFKVKKLVGKTSVRLVEIGQHKEYTEYLSGRCTPDVNDEIGEPFLKKVKGNRVSMAHGTATKLEYCVNNGQREYKSKQFSSYG